MTQAIKKALEKYAELRDSGKMPTMEDKFRQHPTPLRAIRLFCIDCQGGNRLAPSACPAKQCPLWLFRMGKRKAKKKND